MRDPLAIRAAATPGAVGLCTAGADPPDRGTMSHGRESGEQASADGVWTYGHLDAVVDATAAWLQDQGVRPGDHVAGAVDAGPAAVRLVHAALRLGAPYVPLNVRLAPPELRERVEQSDADLVVTTSETDDRVRPALDTMAVMTLEETDADGDRIDPPPRNPETTALLPFTSGSSGQPKAVKLSLANIFASATASAFRLGVLPQDRWYDPLPPYHVGGISPILRATIYGTTVVVEERAGLDPTWTLDRLAAHNPTGISLVPTMLRRLLDAGDLPDSLRFVLLGGAPAPDELIRTCAHEGIPVYPTYGMTETASQIATARPEEAFDHVGTVGRPLVGTRVRILDESNTPQDAGDPGEIVVEGPTLTSGYYGRENDTREAFGPYGFHTGDLGVLDEAGRLWVTGRRDDRILTGGETVAPREVEEALTRHPGVEAASVVGMPDQEWGERVAALVVGEADEESLERHCRESLAGFKCPRTVGFAPELPRTASGTVDREAVRELLQSGSESL